MLLLLPNAVPMKCSSKQNLLQLQLDDKHATLFNFNQFTQEGNYWAQQSVKDHVQSKIRSVEAEIIFEYELACAKVWQYTFDYFIHSCKVIYAINMTLETILAI